MTGYSCFYKPHSPCPPSPQEGGFLWGCGGRLRRPPHPLFFAPFSSAGGGEGGWEDERVSAYGRNIMMYHPQSLIRHLARMAE